MLGRDEGETCTARRLCRHCPRDVGQKPNEPSQALYPSRAPLSVATGRVDWPGMANRGACHRKWLAPTLEGVTDSGDKRVAGSPFLRHVFWASKKCDSRRAQLPEKKCGLARISHHLPPSARFRDARVEKDVFLPDTAGLARQFRYWGYLYTALPMRLRSMLRCFLLISATTRMTSPDAVFGASVATGVMGPSG